MPPVGVPGSRDVSDGGHELTQSNRHKRSPILKDGFGQHMQLIPRG